MLWTGRAPTTAPCTDERDDADLVAAARLDPAAFAPLYERYLNPVYRFCYLRLGGREAAEDATGEVFLRALAGIDGFRDGIFAAWLFRIARNVVVDAHRRRPALPLDAAGERIDPEPTPEERALARDAQAELRAAMAELPEQQRAAIELRLAGWSGDQIARALGKSPDAVKMLRLRALERLRRVLKRGSA